MTGSKQTPILIVDDYGIVVRIIRHHLKRIGFENVDSASNGAEALEKLKAKRYALILSDWHMEPVTGFQLLQRVRADPDYAQTPFIMSTIESRPQYVSAARSAGATDYILKPFNAAVLRAAIVDAFARNAGFEQVFRIDALPGASLKAKGAALQMARSTGYVAGS